jgi:cell wall-associated NlpC family hydrolase
MEFGICIQCVIPVRAEPNHRSEMVTQILFGELIRVILHEKEWARVQLAYDNYEGWLCDSQYLALTETEFVDLFNKETAVTTDFVQLLSNNSRQSIFPVLLGSSLPGYDGKKLIIGGETYSFEGQVSGTGDQAMNPAEYLPSGQDISNDSLFYLNAPYLWGGRTPFGIDCSGLIQMVYKLRKIKLFRDAWQQATQGETVNLITEAKAGDLAFFDDLEGTIIHTGLMIDKTHIIHASGKVRIDPIDHEGIFNEELHRYTHRLRVIKRII